MGRPQRAKPTELIAVGSALLKVGGLVRLVPIGEKTTLLTMSATISAGKMND